MRTTYFILAIICVLLALTSIVAIVVLVSKGSYLFAALAFINMLVCSASSGNFFADVDRIDRKRNR